MIKFIMSIELDNFFLKKAMQKCGIYNYKIKHLTAWDSGINDYRITTKYNISDEEKETIKWIVHHDSGLKIEID